MQGFLETIKYCYNWLVESGIGEIINIGTLPTIIATFVLGYKKINKSSSELIIAQSEKIQMSKEQKETKKEIDNIKSNQEIVSKQLSKLTGLLLIILNNSKIPADAKQQALDVFNSATKEVKKVTEIVEDVVDKIQKQVEENVKLQSENKEETNPYLKNVESLINNDETKN